MLRGKRLPVRGKAAAVDAAGVLRGLVLIQLSDFITSFSIKNETLHVVANADEEVAAGRKPDKFSQGFGAVFVGVGGLPDAVDKVAVLAHALVEFEWRPLEVTAAASSTGTRVCGGGSRGNSRHLEIVAAGGDAEGPGLQKSHAPG
jgi:hypothetical protein